MNPQRHDPKPPAPVLEPGVIYCGDNGQLICIECAGMCAKYTGRDLSGHPVTPVPVTETVAWHQQFGRPLACECGRTIYLLPT
jgi:hypothetical protein